MFLKFIDKYSQPGQIDNKKVLLNVSMEQELDHEV